MGTMTHYRTIGLAIIILFILLNLTPRIHAAEPGTIQINEIMYHPTQPDSTNEWIELYNPTQDTIDLTGWTIADHTETDTITPDPTHGTGTAILPPNTYALLTDLDTTVYDIMTIPETALRLSVDDKTIGNGLGNTKDSLALADTDGTIIDCVEYGEDFDDIPGNPAPLVHQGHSLARIPTQDTDDSQTDFFDCATPTPGGMNTNQTIIMPLSQNPIAPLLLTEVYYNTHPHIKDEFIAISNPTNMTVDVSGWYITDQPTELFDDQAKIIFPDHRQMPANTTWYLTQNASWYHWETGTLPTFEYEDDSRSDVPQLLCYRTLSLNNYEGEITLNAPSGQIIDALIYGNTSYTLEPCWNGSPAPQAGQGDIQKRVRHNGTFLDSNSSLDWVQPRIYHIGQSDFSTWPMPIPGSVIGFVSPDCSYQVVSSAVQNATASLLLNVYELSSLPLASDLLAALERHVNVSILLDGSPVGGISESEKTICSVLSHAGARIRFLQTNESKNVYARYRFDHAKYLVCDNQTLVLTSGNWAATGIPQDPSFGNREWGIAITDKALASYFTTVFTTDFNPARPDSMPLEDMQFPDQGFLPTPSRLTGGYRPHFGVFQASGECQVTPLLSPDSSEEGICDLLRGATTSIYVQQLEFAVTWDGVESPFLSILKAKAAEGVDVRLILNTDPSFDSTTVNEVVAALEGTGVKVRATPVSPFTTIHNKGVVVDNRTVLVSSVNWNENSVRMNREAAVVVGNEGVARYFASVFLADWSWQPPARGVSVPWGDFNYLILLVVVVTVTAVFIAYDWRRRRW